MPGQTSVSRSEVEAAIRDAFGGVRLGFGTSLRQAEVIDNRNQGLTAAELEALRDGEVTDDWAAVEDDELFRDNIAHLDAEGLRYYLPAFMLRLLKGDGQNAEMWVIGTIFALDPRDGHPIGFLELLTPRQRAAIALYVRALPGLVELDVEDTKRLARSFRDVWSRHL